jgi:hypothetical protein
MIAASCWVAAASMTSSQALRTGPQCTGRMPRAGRKGCGQHVDSHIDRAANRVARGYLGRAADEYEPAKSFSVMNEKTLSWELPV